MQFPAGVTWSSAVLRTRADRRPARVDVGERALRSTGKTTGPRPPGRQSPRPCGSDHGIESSSWAELDAPRHPSLRREQSFSDDARRLRDRGLTLAGGASAATQEPVAFQRPARADDRYTGAPSSWQIRDSRLVARALVRRPNHVNQARLYLVRRANGMMCIILRDAGGGAASCTSPAQFGNGLSLSCRLLVGVVRNDVARLTVVGTCGVRHTVKRTRDKGFTWDCRAWKGCRRVVAAVEAYDATGNLLYRTAW